MKKRIYVLLLCISLVLIVAPMNVFADDDPTWTISTEMDNDVLVVTVGINNNPGISGVDVSLEFDSSQLTISEAPTIDTAWHSSMTNYEAQFSGNLLRVGCVNGNNITGDVTLFTLRFTVNSNESYYKISVNGAAYTCIDQTEQVIPMYKVYADYLGMSQASLASNTVISTVEAYGSGYNGPAKAILYCYQGGKFAGCRMQDITINEGETRITFTNVGNIGSGTGEKTYKLILTDGSFVPLVAAESVK